MTTQNIRTGLLVDSSSIGARETSIAPLGRRGALQDEMVMVIWSVAFHGGQEWYSIVVSRGFPRMPRDILFTIIPVTLIV